MTIMPSHFEVDEVTCVCGFEGDGETYEEARADLQKHFEHAARSDTPRASGSGSRGYASKSLAERVRMLADEAWDTGQRDLAHDLHDAARAQEVRERAEVIPFPTNTIPLKGITH